MAMILKLLCMISGLLDFVLSFFLVTRVLLVSLSWHAATVFSVHVAFAVMLRVACMVALMMPQHPPGRRMRNGIIELATAVYLAYILIFTIRSGDSTLLTGSLVLGIAGIAWSHAGVELGRPRIPALLASACVATPIVGMLVRNLLASEGMTLFNAAWSKNAALSWVFLVPQRHPLPLHPNHAARRAARYLLTRRPSRPSLDERRHSASKPPACYWGKVWNDSQYPRRHLRRS